jgi:hypothetical protein
MSKQATLLLTVVARVIGGIFILMPKSTGTAHQAFPIGNRTTMSPSGHFTPSPNPIFVNC